MSNESDSAQDGHDAQGFVSNYTPAILDLRKYLLSADTDPDPSATRRYLLRRFKDDERYALAARILNLAAWFGPMSGEMAVSELDVDRRIVEAVIHELRRNDLLKHAKDGALDVYNLSTGVKERFANLKSELPVGSFKSLEPYRLAGTPRAPEDRPLILEHNIDKATNRLDEILNRLGPPPEPLSSEISPTTPNLPAGVS